MSTNPLFSFSHALTAAVGLGCEGGGGNAQTCFVQTDVSCWNTSARSRRMSLGSQSEQMEWVSIVWRPRAAAW